MTRPVPNGWGEDNEISVMRILYQFTEGAKSVGTPAQLYKSLSKHQTETLSDFWHYMATGITTVDTMTWGSASASRGLGSGLRR